MGKLLLVFLAVGVGAAIWWSCKCCHPPKPPHINPDEWWGPNQLKGKADASIKPFQVKFDEAMVKDLKARLKNHRPFVPPLEGAAFEYGFNSKQLDGWLTYWADKYPFEAREKFMNQFPQFKTNIQGLDIHFIRVKPQVPAGVKVLPLILMHGWPGSVREFYEAIPLLTKPRDGYNFAFEVVVPSLPGYGFSDGAVRPGLGATQVAVVMRNLMHRLGFKKFYVQGGDWGAAIASAMATVFPDEILGHHSNMLVTQHKCATLKTIIGAWFPSLIVEPHLADRMYPLSSFFAYLMEEFGYMHIQATKPDTVGVGLTDSPSGLLAYILEKFSTWTVREHKSLPDGGLTKKFSKDQLIDNLMVYWTSNSITTSMRLYAETMSKKHRENDLENIPTPVPTWAIQAKYEVMYQPAGLLKHKYTNLLNTTVVDDGGHFFAFEMPKVFAEDVFKAVKSFIEFNEKKPKTEL
ncbi:juvenile hormone epoxide hydrolase-like [Pectinophora gossypiella]|uniref:juvenile hormone epoxide hydrolase-like n=1 Tax=Pectinophora gossypiella TaxID=13191 RepID=UPI00214E1EF7|nr:juvenile hormone epoxide hydrolase-like [Pectinophora gossypiella]